MDLANRDRSLWVGLCPSPTTMTRYTMTTMPVSPASETVWARRRSMRPARRRELPMARATASGVLHTMTTSQGWCGQPHSTLRARATTSISAPTATAQPNHCMRWRSTPRDRT